VPVCACLVYLAILSLPKLYVCICTQAYIRVKVNSVCGTVLKMRMEQQYNGNDREKHKCLDDNLSQNHSVLHKSHMDCPRINSEPPLREDSGKPSEL